MRFAVFAWVLPALACRQPSVDVPEPPDMGSVLAAYEAPSAPLTADTVAEIVAKQKEVFDQVQRLGGLDPVLSALDVLGGDTRATTSLAGAGATDTVSSALQAGGVTVTGDGFLTLTRICAGWAGATIPDPGDGSIALTAVFSDEGFEAVVWGEARDCRYRIGGRDVLFDGQLRIHTGTLLVGNAQGAELTIAFEGGAEVDGQDFAAAFDFRLALSSSRVEIDLGLASGNVVFYADEATKTTGFRASNGVWTCDFEEGSCAHDGDTLRLW
jgi:hypothetical protein